MHFLEILTPDAARGIAKLAHDGVTREFPYQPGHVMTDAQDVHLPRSLHPAFYGCYDWHSAVHSHWTLLVLLEQPDLLLDREPITGLMNRHLSAEALQKELAYFYEPGRAGFERPYGWAWVWKLTASLAKSPLPDAENWHANIRLLAELLAERFTKWLDKQVYPCRAGTHGNTAFAMEMGLDYAETCQVPTFGTSLASAASRLYGRDRGFTLRMEPSCNDFISPMLAEISLMGRILPREAWHEWFDKLLPSGELLELQPVAVTDRADGQGVHLDGLNLSRARHLAAISGLMPNAQQGGEFAAAARTHWEAGRRHVFTGDFMGEHWLGTFALLATQEMAVNSMD